MKCQGACKPGSVPPTVCQVAPYRRGQPFLSATDRSAAPATNPGGRVRNRPAPKCAPPLFGLAPGGVCRASPVTRAPVRPYRTLSPLPLTRRSALCGTFPRLRVAPRRAGVTRHPRFAEPGLSSGPCGHAAARPPGGAYLVFPVSRSNRRLNRIAEISPSTSPSMMCGRQRRWKARTAAGASVMS